MTAYRLADRPEGIVDALLAHINSLDEDVMLGFYDPEGMLVDADGVAQRGPDAIRAELRKYFRLGLPMRISARHIFVAGDIASLVLDWSIVGTGPDGAPVDMVATANDIARRGPDGLWRYLIDNPFGTALRQPAR
ncbi:nuclear transport factor 2 family protein [uncultured Massilia sp.]|uniref:YybH family protein n=1 Tax=uncultured Massilia sp. TaxID=169973 RepID=UPI0025E782DD|nr:nuclear transport factor 2 family protein [uncultured Massilia sp.]